MRSPSVRRELLDLTRELRKGTTSARVVLQRGGWWMQQRIGKLETAATCIRNFAPTAVVGLLQTEDYVDADREFILVMAEGALRWNMGGAAVMVEQLDRLVQESRRPNVRLGIIEWTTPARVPGTRGG